ncbi:MAG TPA: thioredoxin-disulfide reductase [Polyangiaceae bacterium]|jgi:thioredoxin reductase (NADPH)|nr:thioredoxin-disulfide reductase [Polyangiaceae bacterium]
MSEPRLHKVLIIGSGPAGLTAAIYAARANLQPLCVEGFNAGGLIPGGQLMFTTEVENFPGFPKGVSGQDLMAAFRAQAEHQGVELITADVQKVDFSSRPFKVWVGEDENILHLAQTVIISTGARANYIGLDTEEQLKNKGVSACAVCDGALFRGQDVVVVGGGDTAMEEASYLAGLCGNVTLIHRREEFRASKAMQERVFANPKIRVLRNHVVTEVLDVSLDKVTGVRVKDLKSGDTRKIDVGALFVAIGHTPLTDLFKGQLEVHDNGYLKVEPGTTRTSVAGVFAAGDVADWVYRQAVTAAGTGCMAALDAERFLTAHGH